MFLFYVLHRDIWRLVASFTSTRKKPRPASDDGVSFGWISLKNPFPICRKPTDVFLLLPSIIYSLGMMLAFIITGYNYGIWQKWLKHFCTGTCYMYRYMCDFFYKGTELLMKIMFYYYYDMIGDFIIYDWHFMIFDWHLIVTIILKFVLIIMVVSCILHWWICTSRT